MSPDKTRRRFLQATAGGFSLALAGCSGQFGGSPSSSEPSGQSVFTGTRFDNSDLLVDLPDDSDLTQVALIGPSGEEFASTSVQVGATTVRLSLFDTLSGRRYTPGGHTLLGIQDGEEIGSLEIDLRPELEIVHVEQYTGGKDLPSNRGNLLVTVQNVGTAPTWVYYIGYQGAPNQIANEFPEERETRIQPEVYLPIPGNEPGRILSPTESEEYLGRHSPLLLARDSDCNGQTIDLTVVAKSGIGDNVRQSLSVGLAEGKFETRFGRTCNEISVEFSDDA